MKNLFKTTLFTLSNPSLFNSVILFVTNSSLLHNPASKVWMVNRELFIFSRTAVKCTKTFLLRVCYLIILIGHFSSPAFASGSSILRELNKRQVGAGPHAVRRRDILCPDNGATRLPTDSEHPDAYICCEDFDLYQSLMEQGREPEARTLLLAPPGSAGRMADIVAAQRKKK